MVTYYGVMATRTRKTKAERREQTAKAVLRILGDEGITALTTGALATELGLTSGALFRHFPSRDAMLDEAVDHALARVEATFPDPALPARDRLLQLARNRIGLLSADAGIAWLFRSEQVGQCLPPAAIGKLAGMGQRSRRFVLEALTEGAARGSIRNDIEPALLLVPVMGTIHALIGRDGIHDATLRSGRTGPEQVLSALAILLSPPGGSTGKKTIGPAGSPPEGDKA